MPRSRPLLVLIAVLLLLAAAYLAGAVTNAAWLGPRETDPAIYWPAVVLLGVLAVLALVGAWFTARRLWRR